MARHWLGVSQGHDMTQGGTQNLVPTSTTALNMSGSRCCPVLQHQQSIPIFGHLTIFGYLTEITRQSNDAFT